MESFADVSSSHYLLSYKRFLDDIAGLWIGTRENFINWADSMNRHLNTLGLSIKDDIKSQWDFYSTGEYCVFLDIRFSNNKGLLTDINIKPT